LEGVLRTLSNPRANSHSLDRIVQRREPMTDLGGDATEARVLALARRFGWNATSFQALEPGYRYFFPDEDACVAYVDTGGAWVAAGPPLADEARIAAIARAFVAAARQAGRRSCFFGTEERFTRLPEPVNENETAVSRV
jgi:lysylphosphatidylglycerol synthetase-like protein (DUF2156 family)